MENGEASERNRTEGDMCVGKKTGIDMGEWKVGMCKRRKVKNGEDMRKGTGKWRGKGKERGRGGLIRRKGTWGGLRGRGTGSGEDYEDGNR